jgi:class 3 adenylate cyclase/streptogramin lyase
MQRRTGGRGLGAVLFTDIVGSTPIAAEMGNTRWGELVARHHRILRGLIHRFGGREVDTAGDGFFVAFERPADAIRCAVAATEAVRGLGIEIRAGISFGELEMVGRKPGGLVVNTAARVMSVAGPGEVLVPASVREIVPGAGVTFTEHGVHQLKGLEGEFRLFGVTGVDGREVVPPLETEQAAERRREIFPTSGRRWALLVGVGAGVLALIVVASILFSGGAETAKQAGGTRYSVAMIDASSGDVRSPVSVGNQRSVSLDFVDHPMAVGEGGVWLLQAPLLLHIDPRHEEIRSDQIDVGFGPSGSVVTAFDAVWVLTGNTLYRINPATDEAAVFLQLPLASGITTSSVAVADSIWVGESDGTLIRLDPRTGARDQSETGRAVDKLAATKEAVWVADVLAGEAVRFDPNDLHQIGKPIEIRGSIDQIFARGDYLWVLDRHSGFVTRITSSDPGGRPARVGDGATDMAVGPDAVWVGDRDGSLYRVDPLTLEVTELPVGAAIIGVGVEEATGSVWVYLDKTVPPAGG